MLIFQNKKNLLDHWFLLNNENGKKRTKMCECKTKSGVLCKKKPRPGSSFCFIHRNCKKQTTKKPSTKKVSPSSESTGFQVIQKRATRKKTGKPVRVVAPEIEYGESKKGDEGKLSEMESKALCLEFEGIRAWQPSSEFLYQFFKKTGGKRYFLSTRSAYIYWADKEIAYKKLQEIAGFEHIMFGTCDSDAKLDYAPGIPATAKFHLYRENDIPMGYDPLEHHYFDQSVSTMNSIREQSIHCWKCVCQRYGLCANWTL